MKKFFLLLLLCLFTFSLASESFASAGGAEPPPPQPTSPDILITSLAGTGLLDNVEIYNQTDTPIDLSSWQLAFSVTDCALLAPIGIPIPSGWLLPKHYLNFERAAAPQNPNDFSVLFDFPDLALFSGCKLRSVQLSQAERLEQTVTITDFSKMPAQHKQRTLSPNSTRSVTGDFVSDYKLATTPFYSEPLYSPPASSGLQILEMLPHARDCSPTDTTSPDCSDYIKLYNPTNATIDLSLYRLRVGYKGQNTSITNTFHFGQLLNPGKYFTLAARDDGDPISLTDTGNFVWLEDSYGVKTYGAPIQYPSASSTSKVSWAWAFDGATWRWTSAPHPFDANYFPPAEVVPPAAPDTPTYAPCSAHQYRSPETHRCRNLIVSASTLVPCKSNQVRNPETNRCRSVLATASSLQPCKAGQVRNPETNRCKSATSTNGQLKPCQAGWERNPETNRCRKGSVLGSATTKVQDIKAPVQSGVRWLLIGGVVVGALAYGLYEWRQELSLKLASSKKFVAGITRIRK